MSRAAVLLAIVLSGSMAAAETIDRVLAVVSGQLIMLSDVNAARELGLQGDGTEAADGGAPGGDAVRAVLSKLIDRQLMLAEVDRYGPPEPAADAIERRVAEIRRRFPDAASFDATLTRSGIDERALRESIRQDLRIRVYLDQRFTSSDPRRQALIDEWLTTLRRRGDVVDLYR